MTHHKKVIDGADLMLELSIYPVAPATMQPTAKPTIIDTFFRNGEPNSSTSRMLTKDRKPRPMNSGEPHLHQGDSRSVQVYPVILTGEAAAPRCRGKAEKSQSWACLNRDSSHRPSWGCPSSRQERLRSVKSRSLKEISGVTSSLTQQPEV